MFSVEWKWLCSLLQTQAKPKTNSMSLGEAIDDSDNLTDFLLDFDEEDWCILITGSLSFRLYIKATDLEFWSRKLLFKLQDEEER